MRDHLTRFLAAAVLLGAAQVNGVAQGLGPRAFPSQQSSARALPAQPAAPAYSQPNSGYGAPGAPSPMKLVDPNRKLQQGDQLSIRIEEDREPPTLLVVNQSGEVTVEPLPLKVRLAGLTVEQASSEIKRRLEADYYYNATVRLSLEQASVTASLGTVTLSGELNRVGSIPIYTERPMTLSQAILEAGGFLAYGDQRKVKVTRQRKDGTTETIEKDVKQIIERGRPDLDLQLQDGDRIHVPKVFFKVN